MSFFSPLWLKRYIYALSLNALLFSYPAHADFLPEPGTDETPRVYLGRSIENKKTHERISLVCSNLSRLESGDWRCLSVRFLRENILNENLKEAWIGPELIVPVHYNSEQIEDLFEKFGKAMKLTGKHIRREKRELLGRRDRSNDLETIGISVSILGGIYLGAIISPVLAPFLAIPGALVFGRGIWGTMQFGAKLTNRMVSPDAYKAFDATTSKDIDSWQFRSLMVSPKIYAAIKSLITSAQNPYAVEGNGISYRGKTIFDNQLEKGWEYEMYDPHTGGWKREQDLNRVWYPEHLEPRKEDQARKKKPRGYFD